MRSTTKYLVAKKLGRKYAVSLLNKVEEDLQKKSSSCCTQLGSKSLDSFVADTER